MLENQKFRPAFVIGPLGQVLSFEDLPSPNHTRWTIQRKAQVVAAIKGGLLTADEACHRYSLADEEIVCWQRSVDRSGMQGLRVTRLRHYRNKYNRQDCHQTRESVVLM